MSQMIFTRIKPAPELLSGATAKKHFEATKSLMTALGDILANRPKTIISLELVATGASISYVVAAPAEIQQEIMAHLYAVLPTCELESLDEWSIFDIAGQLAGASVQFTPPDGELISEEFSGHDPLQPLLETLTAVPGTQRLVLQLLLEPVRRKSSLAVRAAGGISDGFVQVLRDAVMGAKPEPEQVPEDDKIQSALLSANLRIMALAPTKAAAESTVRGAIAAYGGLSVPGKTRICYQKPHRFESWMAKALLRRPERRSAFRLTAAEAANLYHTPLNPRSCPRLEAATSTRLPLPESLPSDGITIGYGAYRDERKAIRLSAADRLRHTYLIGQTGTGKSTLFQAAMLQDMEAGDGCCFIDPHGEVIDWLLPRIPKHRANDVILFDPSDPDALLGLNLLEWRTPQERDLLIQELILLFYKLFDPNRSGIIGPQFEHWLRNAALTITEPKIRGTLVDIPRLFTDQQFCLAARARAEHWAVNDFWNNQMARTADFHKSEMLNYFTSKFGSFLGNSVMHRILSQRNSAFDMRTLMDRRKILLVNLSKGKLGSLNSQMLGALIVAKIQLAAMSRADVPSEQRPPFYVYIDEFQNVVTDSFAQMLSEVRKYGVGLHLAHQYVDQLPENIKQAVVGNVATLMAFRLGQTDAEWLAPHFAPLTADDFTNIAPYHYHLRTIVDGRPTAPFTVASPQITMAPQPALELALRRRMRKYVAATQAAA